MSQAGVLQFKVKFSPNPSIFSLSSTAVCSAYAPKSRASSVEFIDLGPLDPCWGERSRGHLAAGVGSPKLGACPRVPTADLKQVLLLSVSA